MMIGRLACAVGLLELLVACSASPPASRAEPQRGDRDGQGAVRLGLEADGVRVVAAKGAERQRLADVELPVRADLDTKIADRASGVGVRFRLEAARPVPATLTFATVTYGKAAPGAGDVSVAPSLVGAEDFVSFAEKPPREELVYTADVSRAAGLRLVGNVLELVDAAGRPRLRMAAPYVMDHGGHRIDARVSLDDCAADANGEGPWGRAVTPPGRSQCRVRVTWSGGQHVEYPAVLDPSWASTKGNMVAARRAHTATLLGDGTVLVAGGESTSGATTTYLLSAELFDPKTNTFAATGALTGGRSGHVAVHFSNDHVVIAGGRNAAGAVNSTEVYVAGKFHAAGPLHAPRTQAAATLLDTGVALIAGGLDGSGAVVDTAEQFDASTEAWTSISSMPHKRVGYFLTTLQMSRGPMAVAGITTATFGDLADADVYVPTASKWVATGLLSEPRYNFGGAQLADGRVLVASGYQVTKGGCIPGAELYDPNKSAWSKAGTLTTARTEHTLTALAGGTAVAVGGVVRDGQRAITSYLKSVEVYDPTTNAWSALPDLKQARFGHTSTLLADGRVLVAGGSADQGAVATAELLTLDVAGTACKAGSTCSTGFCVDGVCCDTACKESCNGCVRTATGKADGTCALAQAGQDPHGDCKDDGAPTCKQDGLCDGKGACESYASSSCTPSPCAKNDDCTSGFCADGVCCDKACDGKCEACTKAKKGAGADGACGPVAKATDPDIDCGTLGKGVCKGSGTCDGAGACEASTKGKACAAAACSDAVTLAAAAKCGSAGDCTPETTDCTPFVCDAKAVACTKSCAKDGDCAPGAKCMNGVCAKADNGAACAMAVECTSGFCADGFCCDAACDGQCEACDGSGSEGTCNPVSGTPHGGRTACDGSGTCAGSCNGVTGAMCDYPHADRTCDGDSTNTCADGTETVNRCNGLGACVASPQACAPFTCGSEACKTSCKSDADCVDGVHCDSTGVCRPGIALTCTDQTNVKLVDGGTESCGAYRCVNGACGTSCKADGDCADGAKCSGGKCEGGGSSGCGCRVALRPAGSSGALGVVAALLLAGLRRRKAARRRT